MENDGAFGALLTDLSKAFYCLSPKRLIIKRDADRFKISSLRLIYDCLNNRKQKINVNSILSSMLSNTVGGLTLGLLLLKMFLCEFFYFQKV